MKSEEWMQHFVEVTEKRFDRIEEKIDTLLKFKWEIVGGSAVLSILVTVTVQFLIKQ